MRDGPDEWEDVDKAKIRKLHEHTEMHDFKSQFHGVYNLICPKIGKSHDFTLDQTIWRMATQRNKW